MLSLNTKATVHVAGAKDPPRFVNQSYRYTSAAAQTEQHGLGYGLRASVLPPFKGSVLLHPFTSIFRRLRQKLASSPCPYSCFTRRHCTVESSAPSLQAPSNAVYLRVVTTKHFELTFPPPRPHITLFSCSIPSAFGRVAIALFNVDWPSMSCTIALVVGHGRLRQPF